MSISKAMQVLSKRTQSAVSLGCMGKDGWAVSVRALPGLERTTLHGTDAEQAINAARSYVDRTQAEAMRRHESVLARPATAPDNNKVTKTIEAERSEAQTEKQGV
jgi:hypothetical protein